MKAIILAGGSGTRLWPLSRKAFPKQFLKLKADTSLFRETLLRISKVVEPKDTLIVTNREYEIYVESDISSLQGKSYNVVLEPTARNTAPAIVLGIACCMDKLGASEEEVILVCPSDHVIEPKEKFAQYVMQAQELAKKGYLVTFGITPNRPETGYGYIKVGETIYQNAYLVEKFIEKPPMEHAKRYLQEGRYYWNSGIFAFSIKSFLEELSKYAPSIVKALEGGYYNFLNQFESLPDISIDHALMEKSSRSAVILMDIYLNDVGSWDSLFDALPKDAKGNVSIGDVQFIDTKNSLIFGNSRLISLIGIQDCIVVETEDAILVARRGETQKVKDIVKDLEDKKRPEIEENITTYRSWGRYTILERGNGYKIRKVVINPKEKLSLQLHYHRSEHWIVLKGSAKIVLGDREFIIHENQSVYVPKATPHKIENPGVIPLEIIEVQCGEYLSEDDIVRLD